MAPSALAPAQVNEIDPDERQPAAGTKRHRRRRLGFRRRKDIEAAISSSKHKKKKGLQKIIPF